MRQVGLASLRVAEAEENPGGKSVSGLAHFKLMLFKGQLYRHIYKTSGSDGSQLHTNDKYTVVLWLHTS